MDEITVLRIDTLLKRINEVLDDTKDVSFEELSNSSLLLRATCFSIIQIGELMNKLKENLGDQYKDLPWLDARSMRNVIVHDYDKVDVEIVYRTIKNNFPLLKTAFEQIREDLKI